MSNRQYTEEDDDEFFEMLTNGATKEEWDEYYARIENKKKNTMLKNIGEKILEIITILMFVLLISMVGFGIVVGLAAIAYYCIYGPLIALFVLFVLSVLISIISENLFEMIIPFIAIVAACVGMCIVLRLIEEICLWYSL